MDVDAGIGEWPAGVGGGGGGSTSIKSVETNELFNDERLQAVYEYLGALGTLDPQRQFDARRLVDGVIDTPTYPTLDPLEKESRAEDLMRAVRYRGERLLQKPSQGNFEKYKEARISAAVHVLEAMALQHKLPVEFFPYVTAAVEHSLGEADLSVAEAKELVQGTLIRRFNEWSTDSTDTKTLRSIAEAYRAVEGNPRRYGRMMMRLVKMERTK